MTELSPRAARLWLGALVLGPLALRAVFAASVELAPDEAYYLAWARQPDWGYLDHGPLCAWLIAASTAVFGDGELAVRLPALACSAVLSWLLYQTARLAGASRAAALTAVGAASATLLFSAGAVLVTPDAPLALAWGAAVHLFLRASLRGDRRAELGAAVAMAAGFAAKLTTGVLWVLVALTVRTLPSLRRARLLLLALLGLGPLLAWNAAQGWPTLTFHGARVAARASFDLAGLGEFLVGQAGLLCLWPAVLTGAAWVAGARRAARPALRLLTWLGLGAVVPVAALSAIVKVEPNWIAPAYFAAFAGIAVWLSDRPTRLRWGVGSAAFAAAATVAAHLHAVSPWIPLPADRDPSAQLRGWRDLATAVREVRDGLPVLAARYQEASALAYYLPDTTVTTLPDGPRPSQYDLWPSPARTAALALCVWREGEGPDRGRLIEVPGRRYRISRCQPARWRG